MSMIVGLRPATRTWINGSTPTRRLRVGVQMKRGDSGVLDGRDVELELDLLGDEHATGLERGVPGEAPVLAVDGDLALEAHADVAERGLGGAGELEGKRDGLEIGRAACRERGCQDVESSGVAVYVKKKEKR